MKNFNYCKQRNIPCYQNAQRWYMINSIQKLKKSQNPMEKQYYYKIANYYLNGNAYVVL